MSMSGSRKNIIKRKEIQSTGHMPEGGPRSPPAQRQERERHRWGRTSSIQSRHSSWQEITGNCTGHCIKRKINENGKALGVCCHSPSGRRWRLEQRQWQWSYRVEEEFQRNLRGSIYQPTSVVWKMRERSNRTPKFLIWRTE